MRWDGLAPNMRGLWYDQLGRDHRRENSSTLNTPVMNETCTGTFTLVPCSTKKAGTKPLGTLVTPRHKALRRTHQLMGSLARKSLADTRSGSNLLGRTSSRRFRLMVYPADNKENPANCR